MKLPRRSVRPLFPAAPIGGVALLVFGIVAITGFYAVARGPGLRFATFTEVGAFTKAAAPLRVEIRSGGAITVDGEEVSPKDLGGAVSRRLSGVASPSVLLVVAPDVTYRTMLAAYGTIAALEPTPRISIPPRSWVEASESRRETGGGTMNSP